MGNDLTFEKLYKHCAEVEKQNAELQKQVDELTDKLGKVLLGIDIDKMFVAKGVERAVKDTAKEILQMLYDDRNGYWDSCDCGKDETYWRDNSIQGTLNEIKERYGVEVTDETRRKTYNIRTTWRPKNFVCTT